MRTVLIGLNVSVPATPGSDPVAEARRAEALGFDFVSASDHLHGSQPTDEPWTLLSCIAGATTRLRVATRVLGLPYRHPAVVAKMAATLDRLSGGRLILGLGGGALDAEFSAFGLGRWRPRDKVDGVEEAIQLMRGLWTRSPFSFEGRLFRTDGAELEPKPARPIPIWLGTYGERALAVTGRLADGWIPSLGYAPPDQVVGMRERMLAAARAAGRDPDTLTCAYNVEVRVGAGGPERPTVVAGSADEVGERLRGFLELGFNALNFVPTGPGRDEQIERLGREVLALVRADR